MLRGKMFRAREQALQHTFLVLEVHLSAVVLSISHNERSRMCAAEKR